MTDDNQQPAQDEVPQDSAPVDGTVSTNNPHPVDENPEDHIGDETPDPWGVGQTNWRPEYKDEAAPTPESDTDQNPEDNA